MSHRTQKTLFFILGILLFLSAGTAVIFRCRMQVSYAPDTLKESSDKKNNPYCGFYHIYGYELSELGREHATKWCQRTRIHDSESLLQLQINLKNYGESSLTDSALGQLETIFSFFQSKNKQLIVRFVYDWNGNAQKTEPKNVKRIESHMRQLATIVNAHASHIFLLQGIFTGNYGEMHHTHHDSSDRMRSLTKTLASAITPEIFLAVRTPQQLRIITNSGNPLNDKEAHKGSLKARLGLFNDGMLGDAFDVGTYDNTPAIEINQPFEKGTRAEELHFQSQLCQYVPNGGEVIVDNPYNDLMNAIKDLRQMHISYLNADYDLSVLNKWKNSSYTVSKQDPFYGSSGYDYIAAHLGYRYVVRTSYITSKGWFQPQITLGIRLENTGFSSAYRSFRTQIHLLDTTGHTSLSLPVNFDTKELLSGTSRTLLVPFDTKQIPPATYRISLSMKDPKTGLPIHFSNEQTHSDDEVLLGTLTIQ